MITTAGLLLSASFAADSLKEFKEIFARGRI
jgi:hypothetical protein